MMMWSPQSGGVLRSNGSVLLAVAGAGLLVLTGCGGTAEADDDATAPEDAVTLSQGEGPQQSGPTSDPTDSQASGQEEAQDESEPTPVPASSEGPAQNWPAPQIPEEIYEPTEEGAQAALEYWWETWDYARVSGDTEPLRKVSHETCGWCDHVASVPRQVVGRISLVLNVGVVGSARPRCTSLGRFHEMASWGRSSLYSIR